ncbi:MAG: hypothetical protein RR387_06695 [Clostridiales bacterium]
MYRCESCGRVFLTPRVYVQNHGEFGDGNTNECYCGCPKCGSAYYLLAVCPICGELFATDELIAGICTGCGGAILRQLADLADQEFEIAERQYIREMVEI